MQCLEQLLDERLAPHIDLNAGSFPTYSQLRAEVWRFAERQAQVDTGPAPMEIGAIIGKGGKAFPNKTNVTCFNCGRQGHRVADCWSPKQIGQGKGKQPGKYSGKRSGKAATGKNSLSPGGGKPLKGKGKDGKGKTQFGKSGKKTGKGIYSLDENAAEANPNETWPDGEEPCHEIGSLFTLAGNRPEIKIGPERTQKYRSSGGKGRNGEKGLFYYRRHVCL